MESTASGGAPTSQSVQDLVIDFYQALFGQVFLNHFRPLIRDRLKRNEVERQVGGVADAASQTLRRFFENQQLSDHHVEKILGCLASIAGLIPIADLTNPNVLPESIVNELFPRLTSSVQFESVEQEATVRVSLHSIVQSLTLVGPVMSEWQKVSFSTAYELPQRVTMRLNQISSQLDTLAAAGQAEVDERFEIEYRDYLLQRFNRIDAGTVRMATSLAVDLRELFVQPRVRVLPIDPKADAISSREAELMDLAAARKRLEHVKSGASLAGAETEDLGPRDAVIQVKNSLRNVIIGLPGSGKSTLLEWLQLKLADVTEVLVAGGKQVIPLLLRVRELDPLNLPAGATHIERATASSDRATLMPDGWIERQLRSGRVLFMLDGLDEVDPGLRDRHVIPWLAKLCADYPACRFLVTSRPVGYPAGTLRRLGFVECELLDFEEPQVSSYTRHWCTAVRLARNESIEEARREGEADGQRIVSAFQESPYVRDLARNPLMLSAICLVYYFEHGELPRDREVLYRLCVEGLLHNWDQRRGIRSEFSLEDKLRVCRELAIAMQHDDRAEYEEEKVRSEFVSVLGDADQADRLLTHIRIRTGLLLERRAKIFAFAHLTFQEYLAARAVFEGNQSGISLDDLIEQHADGRWNEVIALYCAIAPAWGARRAIEGIIAQADTDQLSQLLAGAYRSADSTLQRDPTLRVQVIQRLSTAPCSDITGLGSQLDYFSDPEVAPWANAAIGSERATYLKPEAYRWLSSHSAMIDEELLVSRLGEWRKLSGIGLCDILELLHRFGADSTLSELAKRGELYLAPAAVSGDESMECQAEEILGQLAFRSMVRHDLDRPGYAAALLRCLRTLLPSESRPSSLLRRVRLIENSPSRIRYPDLLRIQLQFFSVSTAAIRPTAQESMILTWEEIARLMRRLVSEIDRGVDPKTRDDLEATERILRFVQALEQAVVESRRLVRASQA